MELNQAVLGEVLAWGQTLAYFRPVHATNAVAFVQGYLEGVTDAGGARVPGLGIESQEQFSLFAMDMAWLIWLDEIFDDPKDRTGEALDIEPVLHGIEGEARTAAATGFASLRARFEPYLSPEEDRRRWLDTAASTVRAWHREELMSRGALKMSYAEYVENGVHSTAIPHLLTTASLLQGLRISSRLNDVRVQSLVHHLGISCRLHNDIFSVDKEKAEGTSANAVILMEGFLPMDRARAFVSAELDGYNRMLAELVESLGPADPLARLARVMPAAHDVVYRNPRGMYAPSEGTPAATGSTPVLSANTKP